MTLLLEAITTAAYRGVAVELFVCEQADQFVILCAPSPVKARSESMRGMTRAAQWSAPSTAARWKMVTQTYLIFSRLPR